MAWRLGDRAVLGSQCGVQVKDFLALQRQQSAMSPSRAPSDLIPSNSPSQEVSPISIPRKEVGHMFGKSRFPSRRFLPTPLDAILPWPWRLRSPRGSGTTCCCRTRCGTMWRSISSRHGRSFEAESSNGAGVGLGETPFVFLVVTCFPKKNNPQIGSKT